MKFAVYLLSVLPFAVQAQDATPSRVCSTISGLSKSQLEEESTTSDFVINDSIVRTAGENATFTVSKCEHETDDLDLVFYGTYFEDPDSSIASSGFACETTYQGEACSE